MIEYKRMKGKKWVEFQEHDTKISYHRSYTFGGVEFIAYTGYRKLLDFEFWLERKNARIKIADAEAWIEKLEETLKNHEDISDSLRAQVRMANEKIERLECGYTLTLNNAEAFSSDDDARIEIEELASKLATQEDITQGRTYHLNVVGEKIEELERKLCGLQESLRIAENKIGSLEGKLTYTRERIRELVMERCDADAKIEELEENLKNQRDISDTLAEELLPNLSPFSSDDDVCREVADRIYDNDLTVEQIKDKIRVYKKAHYPDVLADYTIRK